MKKILFCAILLQIAPSITIAEDLQGFKPNSMGVLGDSISAGFLSQQTRGQLGTLQMTFLLQQLITSRWISGAAKAFETPGTSWAGGTKESDSVQSHFERLSALEPNAKIQLKNAAKSGADSIDLADKLVGDLQKWSRETLHQESPDYITLLIGANDICAENVNDMTPVQEYERNIARSIEMLLKNSPQTKILISSLPNIEKLREVAVNSKVFSDRPMTCGDLWKTLKVCPTLTTLEGPDRILVKERVEAYNQTLSDLAKAYGDLYPSQIVYSSALYNTEFTENHLSIDCFHPNAKGHQLISEKTWSDLHSPQR